MRIFRGIRYLLFGNQIQKRRARLELARIAASLFGNFYLNEDYQRWRDDSDFLLQYKKLSPESPYSQDRKYIVRELTRLTHDLDGEMAECGCYQGATAWFIANENRNVNLHLFDSFQGLSEPGVDDELEETGTHFWNKGILSSTEEQTKKTLQEFNHVHYHKGWIPDKFSAVEDIVFKLIHIDVDLYQPTLDSIRFFYPRMIKNGIIILDDYGFKTCPGAYKAVNEFMSDKPEYIVNLTSGQGLIIKQ